MSKRIRKKEKQKQAQAGTLNIRELWQEKKQILLLALAFAVLMGIFYGFWFSEIFMTNILEPVVKANAFVASKMLNLFGFDSIASGSNINSSTTSFSVSIKNGCDALEPVAIFTFIVLLAPVSLNSKLRGMATGIPLLLLLNQLRIISLYIFGIYSPFLFELFHVQVWQAIFIVITLMILVYWVVWAVGKERKTQQ